MCVVNINFRVRTVTGKMKGKDARMVTGDSRGRRWGLGVARGMSRGRDVGGC